MKARIVLLLLAMISATPRANAGPCSTLASRYEIAEKLRLAAEERPVHVTFLTNAEGVKMPGYLKAKHPDEMNIILHYQFGQLHVKNDRFDVVVWFKGYPERLTVPFSAVKAFWDNTEPKCSGN